MTPIVHARGYTLITLRELRIDLKELDDLGKALSDQQLELLQDGHPYEEIRGADIRPNAAS